MRGASSRRWRGGMPSPSSALTMLGMIAQMEGDKTQAIDYFQRAVDLDPRAAIAANNLAWIYAERGEKLDYALQLAQTAVQVMPKAPEAQDTLGWVYYKRKTAEPAIAAVSSDARTRRGQPDLPLPPRVGVPARGGSGAPRGNRSNARWSLADGSAVGFGGAAAPSARFRPASK